MADLTIIKTNGKAEDFLKEYDGKAIQLFIASLENLPSNSDHEVGDLLLSDECETKFALLVKEYLSGKIISEALRISIFELLQYMKDNNIECNCMVISRDAFGSSKEEIMFTCTMREIIVFLLSNVNDMTIVITDCEE